MSFAVFSIFAASSSGDPDNLGVYLDVSEDHYAYEHLKDLASKNLLFSRTDCDDQKFCPDDNLNRWTAAVWLTAAANLPVDNGGSLWAFEDVDSDQWWAAHVDTSAENGITNSCYQQPRKFCPQGTVLRKHMALFIDRAFDLPEEVLPAGFTDIEGGSDEATTSINRLYAAGITAGCSQDPLKFCPNDPISRARAATMLSGALNYESPGDQNREIPSDDDLNIDSANTDDDHTETPTSGVFQPHVDISWDVTEDKFIIKVTTYDDQIIESVGHGYPFIYTLGGCDDTTDYQDIATYDILQDSSLDSTGIRIAEAREYNWHDDGDYLHDDYDGGNESFVPSVCFAINYRNGSNQPLMQLIKVRETQKTEKYRKLTEAEKIEIKENFGDLIDSASLTPLGQEIAYGKYGLRYHLVDAVNECGAGDFGALYNDGTICFWTQNPTQGVFTHEYLHHIWSLLSLSEKKALALRIDQIVETAICSSSLGSYSFADDEKALLGESLFGYALQNRPDIFNEPDFKDENGDYEYEAVIEQACLLDAQVWRVDEFHSILGAVVRRLPVDLEDHYGKYLNNRSSVVEDTWENWIEEFDEPIVEDKPDCDEDMTNVNGVCVFDDEDDL